MDFKYRSTFTAVARLLNAENQDRFIAKASLNSLKGLVPDGLDLDAPDMLYFAANGAVAALANRNGDCVDQSTAVAINPTAKHKYISVDHDRDKIVGVILQPGFSKFGSNEPMTDEGAAASKEPFNMSVMGALWRVVNPLLSKYLVKIGDSTDEEALSLSWEVGFSSYDIGIGALNTFDAERITGSDARFNAYDKILRANDGLGLDSNHKPVFRILTGNPTILGYSIVANPAALVKGILPLPEVKDPIHMKADEAAKDGPVQNVPPADEIPASAAIAEKNEESVLTRSKLRVTPSTITMKIESLEQLATQWEAFTKLTSTAAVDSVRSYIADHIANEAEKWQKERDAKENIVKTVEAAKVESEQKVKDLEDTLSHLKDELAAIKEESAASERKAKFGERMAAFNDEFDLSNKENKIIASKIKDLTDETFAAYLDECKVLMQEKSKAHKAALEAEAAKKAPAKDAKKSDKKDKSKDDSDDDPKDDPKDDDDSKAAVDVKQAIASVKEDPAQAKLPNMVSVDVNLMAEMKEAFANSFRVEGKPLPKSKKD